MSIEYNEYVTFTVTVNVYANAKVVTEEDIENGRTTKAKQFFEELRAEYGY